MILIFVIQFIGILHQSRKNYMEPLQSTNREAFNEDLLVEKPKPFLTKKKLVILVVSVVLTLGAIIGLTLGLYFHFRPTSIHISSLVSNTKEGNAFLATKFNYKDNNLVEDNIDEAMSIMFSGLNGTNSRRLLQADTPNTYVDTTIHYEHESGLKFKLRNHKVYHLEVSLNDLMQYFSNYQQQNLVSNSARLLQTMNIEQPYDGETQIVNGSDVYDQFRSQIVQALKNQYGNNVSINVTQTKKYPLKFNNQTGNFQPATVMNTARRLWFFSHIFHAAKHFVSHVVHKTAHFFEKNGPTILKYGAITALSAVDLFQTRSYSGVKQIIDNFRSGNVYQAVKNTAQDVVKKYAPPLVSTTFNSVADTCFANPPTFHCTRKGVQSAVKSDFVPYLANYAINTGFNLLQDLLF